MFVVYFQVRKGFFFDMSYVYRQRLFKRTYSVVSQSKWHSVVGLEVHAQLNTKSKLFSGAENTFGGRVNNCVSLFDASIPGTLPVLNRKCVQLAIMAALALSCKVNEVSTFDRKHYFYADQPNGYQITQQRAPLAQNGVIEFQVYTPGVHKKPYSKSSKIKQIQLEQDSGKSLHDHELKRSLLDLNRAGAPLIELVFEPDLEDGEEAAALVKELTLIMQSLGACSGSMHEGALRVDANVSVHRPGTPLGIRTEIKNIGSVRAVANAIRHEIERQKSVLENGGRIKNETRAWNSVTKVTVPMRDKEVVQDYRYMPEPNLPPLRVNLRTKDDTPDVISVPLIREQLPKLPEEIRTDLIRDLKLKPEYAIRLVNEPILLEYFQELTHEKTRDPAKVANIILNDLLSVLHRNKIDPNDCPITLKQIKEVTDLLLQRSVNLKIFRLVIEELFRLKDSNITPLSIVKEKGWLMISDEKEIAKKCKEVMDDNPKIVAQYRRGKVKVFQALINILHKNTNNALDMILANKIMEELLKRDK